MKLFRFAASDNHKAILKVHDILGPGALVYSTHRTPEGVEIIAGLPTDADEAENAPSQSQSLYVKQAQTAQADSSMIRSLNIQLQLMDENIKKLLSHISHLYDVVSDNPPKKKKASRWNLFRRSNRTRKNIQEGIYGPAAAH